ncbi:DUF1566 domain-containing protein [Desulfococcaceae bacterium HSG7]|nr:DUF1566 domain-containing protein [Desulfococcaceae bacterium HSG7]
MSNLQKKIDLNKSEIEPSRFYKIPQYQRRSKPFDSVSEEEGGLCFGLDKNRHPENYIQNEFELIKNYEVVVVVDHATGLMWQQGGSAYPIQYHEALEYVEGLNSSQFAGFNGWRLPTIDELTSLLTKNQQDNDLYIDWIFDSNQEWCWSSDKGSSELAWYVDFKDGFVDVSSFDDPGYVRLVLAGQWQRMLSGKSESSYSQDTPVPDLKRDAFETVEEFQKRIADYKPVPVLAGSAELIKDKYDINTGIFPVKISWKKWAETFVNKSKKTHIIAERDLARSIYESGHEHPVYALLGTDGKKAVISKIELYVNNQPFKIETSIFYKKPEYPRRSKPFDSVSDEEVQSHFNLDDNWRPKKYFRNEFELINNGKVVADHATGLMWQQCGSSARMKYPDTLKYVQRLNSSQLAGFNDWRLPTIDELTSLMTKNEQKSELFIDPIFDSTQKWCWSSDKRAPEGAWYFAFYGGGVSWPNTGYNLYVRAVRAGHGERAILGVTKLVYAPDKSFKIKASSTFENSLGMKFVYIVPGTFIMGSPEDETVLLDDEYRQNEVQHNVTLTQGFYMQTTAVTIGQWREFVQSGYKSQAETQGGATVLTGKIWKKLKIKKLAYWNNPGFKQTDAYPVTCISWNDAQAYIQWLNAKERRDYRLPTEAEWEYACRAGSQTPFAFGKCLSTQEANYNGKRPLPGCPKGAYRKRTVPAGNLVANAWGLYDMRRNWRMDPIGRSAMNGFRLVLLPGQE